MWCMLWFSSTSWYLLLWLRVILNTLSSWEAGSYFSRLCSIYESHWSRRGQSDWSANHANVGIIIFYIIPLRLQRWYRKKRIKFEEWGYSCCSTYSGRGLGPGYSRVRARPDKKCHRKTKKLKASLKEKRTIFCSYNLDLSIQQCLLNLC